MNAPDPARPDAILKNPGDTLNVRQLCDLRPAPACQLTHVGSESYAAKLAAEARRNVRSTKSEMMLSLTKLITVVGIALIPLGIILFLRHFLSVFQGLPLRDSVESTVSALIGMIPEGPLPADERRHRGQLPEAIAQARARAGYELHRDAGPCGRALRG